MAESIHISGYTQVKTSSSVIGETSADNDIRIKIIKGTKKIHTNQSGPELWDSIINLGVRAILTIPLQKFDDAVLNPLLAKPAATEGQNGTLGGSIASFPLSIVPTNGSGYYFANCWIIDNYEISKFGYEENIIMLTVEAAPDPSAGATAPLYTRT